MPVVLVGPPSATSPARIQQQGTAARFIAAVNAHPAFTLTGILAIYLAIACIQAAHKLLWADELFTLAVARQGSLSAIWRALLAGADPNPPLSHWLVLVSTRLFGLSALAIRIPSILCIFTALCALWGTLRRWLPPAYAALGLLAFHDHPRLRPRLQRPLLRSAAGVQPHRPGALARLL